MRDDMTQPKKLTLELQVWIDARRRFHLSHAQVQMARELGMNPKKLGGLTNHKQERWKLPLHRYIEELYLKRFKKERPDCVRPIEQMVADSAHKQAERKEHKRQQPKGTHPQNADDGDAARARDCPVNAPLGHRCSGQYDDRGEE